MQIQVFSLAEVHVPEVHRSEVRTLGNFFPPQLVLFVRCACNGRRPFKHGDGSIGQEVGYEIMDEYTGSFVYDVSKQLKCQGLCTHSKALRDVLHDALLFHSFSENINGQYMCKTCWCTHNQASELEFKNKFARCMRSHEQREMRALAASVSAPRLRRGTASTSASQQHVRDQSVSAAEAAAQHGDGSRRARRRDKRSDLDRTGQPGCQDSDVDQNPPNPMEDTPDAAVDRTTESRIQEKTRQVKELSALGNHAYDIHADDNLMVHEAKRMRESMSAKMVVKGLMQAISRRQGPSGDVDPEDAKILRFLDDNRHVFEHTRPGTGAPAKGKSVGDAVMQLREQASKDPQHPDADTRLLVIDKLLHSDSTNSLTAASAARRVLTKVVHNVSCRYAPGPRLACVAPFLWRLHPDVYALYMCTLDKLVVLHVAGSSQNAAGIPDDVQTNVGGPHGGRQDLAMF